MKKIEEILDELSKDNPQITQQEYDAAKLFVDAERNKILKDINSNLKRINTNLTSIKTRISHLA